MFEEKEPEDIFAGVEPAGPEPLRPRGAISPTVPGRPGAPAPVGARPTPEASPPKKRKLFYVLIAVFLLAVLGVGGWLTWLKFFQQPAVPEVVPTAPTEIPVNTPTPAAPEVTPPGEEVPSPEVTPEATPPDSDLDGLTDEEETTLGTDLNKADTDDDGLTDREEVRIYDTDPLNSDTDGDGYLDGEEVRGGYNPKGSGKLFELPE